MPFTKKISCSTSFYKMLIRGLCKSFLVSPPAQFALLCLLQSTSKILPIFKGTCHNNFLSSAELISTYNFASGSLDYQDKDGKKFLFSESVAITQNNMLKSIESLVPLDRQVVFVGHNIRHGLRALDLLYFDFSKLSITTLDT